MSIRSGASCGLGCSWRSEQGIGRWTLLVFGILVGTGVFTAYHVMPFYYYYYELQNQMESLVRVAGVNTDKEIRQKLADHMRRMEIPASVDEVQMERGPNRIKMRLDYQEHFSISFRGNDHHIHTFDFTAEAEGDY